MSELNYILGIDLGTTALKGALFDTAGRLIARHSMTYPIQRHADGRVEQLAEDWLEAFWVVLDRLMAGRDPSRLIAVGMVSQVNTNVFVDEHGQALMPAIAATGPRSFGLDEEYTPIELLAPGGATT
jgi:xylulokinase